MSLRLHQPMSPGSTNRYQDGAKLGTDLSKPGLPSLQMKICFRELVRIQGCHRETAPPLLTSTVHTPVPQQSLAIRDVCLPASLPFSLRNNQVEEKSDRLRCPGTQDQV